LVEIGQRIQKREQSSVEATQAQLDRTRTSMPIEKLAYVMLRRRWSRRHAAEKGNRSGRGEGPLQGPTAVKDLCWSKDAPDRGGHDDLSDYARARMRRRLQTQRGRCVILGKLQLTEGAYADHHRRSTHRETRGMRRSGRAHLRAGPASRPPAGLCYGLAGIDTGGSIRFRRPPQCDRPEANLGRVSRYGVFELAATLDIIGPMARSAVDCGAILGAIAGSDPNDPTAVLEPVPNTWRFERSLRGTRIGVDPRWTSEGVDAAAARIFQDALRGAAVWRRNS